MTIAAGFWCNEGVVLCADTQETIRGYTKNYDGKVSTTIFPNRCVIAIAGAGTTDYIKTAEKKALQGIGQIEPKDIQKHLEQNLLEFFDKHIAPWAYHSDPPTVELLIAVATEHRHELFHYSGTSFYRVSTAKAIGAGILLADTLISQFVWGDIGTIDGLTSTAIHILAKVKKHVDTCGGFTHLVALKSGPNATISETSEIERMEKELEEIERQSLGKLKIDILAQKPKLLWLLDSIPWSGEPRGNEETI